AVGAQRGRSAAARKRARLAGAWYEAVVRHDPSSGDSDNALWQAGRLSLDAFATFGQAQDRAAGLRLLRRLAAEYPTSKLAKRVPLQVNAPAPGAKTRLATIMEIRRAALPDVVRITIALDGEVAFHD